MGNEFTALSRSYRLFLLARSKPAAGKRSALPVLASIFLNIISYESS